VVVLRCPRRLNDGLPPSPRSSWSALSPFASAFQSLISVQPTLALQSVSTFVTMRYQFAFRSTTEKQTMTFDKTSLLSVRSSSRRDDDRDDDHWDTYQTLVFLKSFFRPLSPNLALLHQMVSFGTPGSGLVRWSLPRERLAISDRLLAHTGDIIYALPCRTRSSVIRRGYERPDKRNCVCNGKPGVLLSSKLPPKKKQYSTKYHINIARSTKQQTRLYLIEYIHSGKSPSNQCLPWDLIVVTNIAIAGVCCYRKSPG